MFIENGFNDFITKPMSGRDLAEMILKWLPSGKVREGAGTENHPQAKAPGEERALAKLVKCRGLDLAAAKETTGSYANLASAVRDFCGQIPAKAALIEKYAAEGDIESYTIEVHGLKSSARMIGAKELGEQAAYLEACGHKKELEEIARKTPALMERYRSYLQKLRPAVDDGGVRGGGAFVSAPILLDELSRLREALKEYDIDAADKWASAAERYEVPQKVRPLLDKVLDAVRAVDYIGAIRCIDELTDSL
jgi:HPt (histidine-containing phosphotransfer) domain-containing protein